MLGFITLINSLTVGAQYTSCMEGYYGPWCQGECSCENFEDCSDGSVNIVSKKK
jgi:hypothetical protein